MELALQLVRAEPIEASALCHRCDLRDIHLPGLQPAQAAIDVVGAEVP